MSGDQASAFKQIEIYLGRCWRGFVNDKGWKVFISVVLITAIIGLVLGDDTFERYADTKNGAFALVCACIWIGIFNSIRTVCRERDIVKREHRTGLNFASYIASHWIYEAALCLVEALIVTVIVALICYDHFIDAGVFAPPAVELFVTFFLITFSSDALGLLISSIVRSENTAMTVMPFALIIQLVLSGVIFKLEGVAEYISYLTISRWGLDAICATAHMNEMLEVGVGQAESVVEYAATFENLVGLWGILLLFAVCYGVLSIVALRAFND